MITLNKSRIWISFLRWSEMIVVLMIVVLLFGTTFGFARDPGSPGVPFIRVNWTYDSVEGKTPIANMDISVTVLDAGGIVKGDPCEGQSGGDSDFHIQCEVDIIIGDTVQVDIEGALSEVEVVQMTGDVDSIASTVSGEIFGVVCPATVYGEVWSETGTPTLYGTAIDDDLDGDCDYTLDFTPWDVLQGDYLFIVYEQPEPVNGYLLQVGFVRNDLDVGVDVSKNRVWGDTTPGFEVEITISDSSGSKGSGSTIANVDGFYWLDSIGENVDISPGDTVEVTANGVAAIVNVPDPFNVTLDPGETQILGYGPLDGDMWVEVEVNSEYYVYCDQVPVDEFGYWETNSINCPGLVELYETDRGVVGFVTEEAHQVILWFPSPEIVSVTAPYDPVAMINGEAIIPASAIFTYPIAGANFNAEWFWGDDTTTFLEDVTSPVFSDHTYTEPGVYELKLIITDAEGVSDREKFQYVVVYNPEGGFVTGGGWIDSPAGAYAPDPSLSGKANFGFVSKYKKGATVPTGNTEFQFKAGDLNFHSSSYDWLVVTGSDYARFKGIGTINGEGEYKFMLWAGDSEPDTFRIKIWLEDQDGVENVIYDNGMDQELGGGNIVVHNQK